MRERQGEGGKISAFRRNVYKVIIILKMMMIMMILIIIMLIKKKATMAIIQMTILRLTKTEGW